ncbi:Lar family restriction alleviation protein [Rhodopseudomonas palustris]|uniref:Lar family restriction alleviation protein n=1 Tax=Rhodopseudomonas palustris TaxID=1076 RepID=UPI000CEC1771|nr:hypothetical protein CKO39_18315 [Rhodopseudomonas palustris]
MRIAKAKPCPFCGSTDSFVERMDLSMWQRVCNDCFTHGPCVHDDGRDLSEERAEAEATREWNRRKRRRRGVDVGISMR